MGAMRMRDETRMNEEIEREDDEEEKGDE